VGWLAKIQRRDSEVRVVPKFDPSIPPIEVATLKRLSWDLGVGSFEWHRTHWAVKDADLLTVLEENALRGGNTSAKDSGLPPYEATRGQDAVAAVRSSEVASGPPAKIFLAHGRDNGAKQDVARYLERLGLEPVILHERPNAGRTLISKFREESADVVFAVVLMTPDDCGGLNGTSTTRPRARQNVVFELGFFLGKLGPERVCALVGGDMEKPSDFEAVVYIEYGHGTSWQLELARELRAAGIPFDHSKAV
jgi:predicted nucleotide-binding protein